MTDLPQQSNLPTPAPVIPTSTPPPTQPISYPGGGKEAEGMHIVSPELPLRAVGQEVSLPKEVQQVGVSVIPTTVPLPPQIQQMGVQSVGANVHPTSTNGSGVTLPLTDEQIAKGLHESIATSIRWLAEWCTRQILMMHDKVNSSSDVRRQT